jgi:hypothetical protein
MSYYFMNLGFPSLEMYLNNIGSWEITQINMLEEILGFLC